MRYVDEKRLRVGHLVIFALGIGLAVAGFWDAARNDQQYTTYLIAAMIGLLIISVAFYAITELILRDAVQLAPIGIHAGARPTAVGAGSGTGAARTPGAAGYPSVHVRTATETLYASPRQSAATHFGPWPGRAYGRAEPAGPSAGAYAFSTPPPITRKSSPILTPHEPPQPIRPEPPRPKREGKKGKERTLVAVPTPPTEPLLEFKEEGLTLPGPAAVPYIVSPKVEETFPLEVGDPFSAVASPVRAAKGDAPAGRGMETARIVCGACSLYFTLHLDPGRPQQVACPRCEKQLVVSGHQRFEPHLRLRCRSCGDALHMPKMHDASAVQCATCGQVNTFRATPGKGGRGPVAG